MSMLRKIRDDKVKLGIIGLGYIGLPLAAKFARRYDTVGFDVKPERLEALRRGEDATLETSSEDLKAAIRLKYSGDPADLKDRDIFIVTVPTPVDQYNRPDLTLLHLANETVGSVMKPGAIVIYESTVYPGCTEEECVPVLEQFSGLKFNIDFFCGYSPERVNPGDKEHTLTNIPKITSGSTPEAAEVVDTLYGVILKGGTYRAGSIKVAEAAKVIENAQRDLNIAFVNELAKIFRLIGIDTREVLAAAATEWNFLPFKPGLPGGHCIGVDPYYLAHKAQALGYLPEVILAGRRINEGMGKYTAVEVIKLMIRNGQKIVGARVLVLGITFKENCPDIRCSGAAAMVRGLQEFGCLIDIYDPWADPVEVEREYGFTSKKGLASLLPGGYDAIVPAVAHREFATLDFQFYKKHDAVVFDVQGILPPEMIDERL